MACKGCGAKDKTSGFCSTSCYMNWYKRKYKEMQKAINKVWA